MHTFVIASIVLAAQASPTAPQAPVPAAPAAPAAPAPEPIVLPVERRNSAGLATAIDALRSRFPTLISARQLATSVGKLPIPMLVLSSDAAQADARPGILLVAGMEGPRWSAGEAALVAAEVLARDHADLLKQVTIYVVPRANPDAGEAFSATLLRDYSGNAYPHDNDRDHKFDEDPPIDLNGDGFITQMRLAGAKPPWSNPTVVADAADARLMKKPDATKGQTPVYTLWNEGIDADADGRIGEDWKGGINIDRNFPHRWVEFEDEAGAYPLIAPESKALADFVIANPRIVAAVILGRNDTMVNVPDGKAKTDAGIAAMLDEADVAPYAEVAKAYREALGQKRAASNDTAGSFLAWMNAQRGVPTFGAQLWGRPDVPPKEAAKGGPADGAKDAAKDAPKDSAKDAAKDPPKPAPEAAKPEAPAAVTEGARPEGARPEGARPAGAAPPEGARRGQRGPRGGMGGPTAGPRRAEASTEAPKPMDEDDAAWLAYSDQVRGGIGFVPWTKTPHPQLGEVEVGGWVAGFKDNPPLPEVRPLGEKTGAFLAKLAEFRPVVELREPTLTVMGPGLYRINAELANTGRLPTIERGGRAEGVTPAHVVRISPPVERIKSGRRTDIVRGLDPGEVRAYDWIVAASPEELVEVQLLFAGAPLKSFAFRDGVRVDAPAAPPAAAGRPPAPEFSAPRTPQPQPPSSTPIPTSAKGGAK